MTGLRRIGAGTPVTITLAGVLGAREWDSLALALLARAVLARTLAGRYPAFGPQRFAEAAA